MNQPQSVSIKCPYCNLTNFATAEYCKRCKNALQATQPQRGMHPADGNTININISLPQTQMSGRPPQPTVNVNGIPAQHPVQHQPQPRYQPQPHPHQLPPQPQYHQPPRPTLPPPPPSFRQAAPRTPGEYNLQNQEGFAQWQQMNRQVEHHEQQAQQPQYAPQPQYQHYQYPQSPGHHAPVYLQSGPGYVSVPPQRAFRSSNELIVHELAELPPYCVKCGEDASPYSGGSLIKQKYSYCHPAVWIAIISPLIFVILRLVLSKRANVYLPLCHNHVESRKTTGQFLIGGGVVSMLIIFFIGGAGSGGLAVLLFFAAVIGLALGYEYSYKPLRASKVDKDYVYLTGVDNGYLNRVPHA